jgi:Na+-driven multidrug efflux pump
LTIMVSNRYGAKDYRELKRIKVIGIAVATSFAVISMLSTAILFLGYLFSRLFYSQAIFKRFC